MKLVPMRFKGVEWHHNPREISFECDKEINELKAPYGNAYIQNMGRKNMKISGTGELYGEDCLEQFNRLLKLFKEGGQGVLAIAHMTPMFAVFENINVIGEPIPDVLTYSFVFREVMENKRDEVQTSHLAENSENLWDISYKYGISIDALVKLNPHIKRPDMDLTGKAVALC